LVEYQDSGEHGEDVRYLEEGRVGRESAAVTVLIEL
jgi:hypothetical protein